MGSVHLSVLPYLYWQIRLFLVLNSFYLQISHMGLRPIIYVFDCYMGKNATHEFHVICFHVKFTCMPHVNFTWIGHTREFHMFGCTRVIHVYDQFMWISCVWSYTWISRVQPNTWNSRVWLIHVIFTCLKCIWNNLKHALGTCKNFKNIFVHT